MANNNVKNSAKRTEFKQTFNFKNLGESLKDFDVHFFDYHFRRECKNGRISEEEQEKMKNLYPWIFLEHCLFISEDISIGFGIIYGMLQYDDEKQTYYIDDLIDAPIYLSPEELNCIYWTWPDYEGELQDKVINAHYGY